MLVGKVFSKSMSMRYIVIKPSGFDTEKCLAGIQNPSVKQELIENTNRSVEMGSFGYPTFFVNGDVYFGKDKLREVEHAILNMSS
jgi:2-hydroxychromene-2-carboxylate isomerase